MASSMGVSPRHDIVDRRHVRGGLWPHGTRVMVRKRKSWREATIISRLDPNHWRAEYPGGGSGMFREADIRAYDPERDANIAEQPRRDLSREPLDARYERVREAGPTTRSISTGCSTSPKPATGMGCATTRSKAATAIQKWSRATARICWPCTPLRRPPHERARSTGALPLWAINGLVLQCKQRGALRLQRFANIGW